MIPKEILEKILRIDITTNRLVTDVFAGAYHSVFKGRGMEFDEVREYQPGDDIRTIDWNVTARTGFPHIKKYVEERELTVMILVDASASVHFASTNQMKNKLAAEIAAVLAFAAIRNNDKVGLLMFTDDVELYIPPKKGKSHVLRVIREILYFKPKAKGTDLPKVLEYLTKVLRRRSTVFVISDFLDPKSDLTPIQRSIRVANQHHDLIAITLTDPREIELPNCSLVEVMDAETGARKVIDTSNVRLRREYNAKALSLIKSRSRLFDSIGIDHIDISTDVPYTKALVSFLPKGAIAWRDNTMNDIKDVKPPINLPDLWLLLWLLLALMAIAAGVYLFLRFKKPPQARVVPKAPELPAWEKAYQELEALRQENLLDKGLFKEFFTRVSDIARHYMENRFNIHAPHMSTEEFLYYLGISGHLNETQKNALKDFLNSCDMVKFAKYSPTTKEALENFDLARKLVDDTKI